MYIGPQNQLAPIKQQGRIMELGFFGPKPFCHLDEPWYQRRLYMIAYEYVQWSLSGAYTLTRVSMYKGVLEVSRLCIYV